MTDLVRREDVLALARQYDEASQEAPVPFAEFLSRLRALPPAQGKVDGEVEDLRARVLELEAVLRDIVVTDDGAMREMQSLGIEVADETRALTERARSALDPRP